MREFRFEPLRQRSQERTVAAEKGYLHSFVPITSNTLHDYASSRQRRMGVDARTTPDGRTGRQTISTINGTNRHRPRPRPVYPAMCQEVHNALPDRKQACASSSVRSPKRTTWRSARIHPALAYVHCLADTA